jgi:hypothetical protein
MNFSDPNIGFVFGYKSRVTSEGFLSGIVQIFAAKSSWREIRPYWSRPEKS